MIGNEFEDSEFLYPYYRFQEAGYKVDVVGSKAKATYTGKHGVPFKADLSPEEVDVNEYEAVIIPGGKAPDSMRLDKGLVKIVKTAHESGKVIAELFAVPFRMGLTATYIREDEGHKTLPRLVGNIVYELGTEDLAGKRIGGFRNRFSKDSPRFLLPCPMKLDLG